MQFNWPDGFERIPNEAWTTSPIDALAKGYDAVKTHGWYQNLEPAVRSIGDHLKDGDLLLDYSGGTGIFAERLLESVPDRQFGIVIVDASPKFLRVALEKFHANPHVALRLIQYLKDKKRLQFVDEVLDCKFDFLVSTNAIHLYYDLEDTLLSWTRVLRPGSEVLIQSGSIRNPAAKPGEWIIDETVHAIYEAAVRIVEKDDRYAKYREVLKTPEKMAAYSELRNKFFLPARSLSHYTSQLEAAGFRHLTVSSQTIEARVDEWTKFLEVYLDGILGWIGGVPKIEGKPPAAEALRDRLRLFHEAAHVAFAGKPTFLCCWTYITAKL